MDFINLCHGIDVINQRLVDNNSDYRIFCREDYGLGIIIYDYTKRYPEEKIIYAGIDASLGLRKTQLYIEYRLTANTL